MGTTKIKVISNAAVRLGDSSLSSLNESREAARIGVSLYDTCYEALLTDARWGFCTKKLTLSLHTETPLNEWKYAYRLPADDILTIDVYPRNVNFVISGKLILADISPLDIDYMFKPAEGDLPPYFVQILELKLAMDMALSLTGQMSLKKELEKDYFGVPGKVGAYSRARTRDRQQYPPTLPSDAPFVQARF